MSVKQEFEMCTDVMPESMEPKREVIPFQSPELPFVLNKATAKSPPQVSSISISCSSFRGSFRGSNRGPPMEVSQVLFAETYLFSFYFADF